MSTDDLLDEAARLADGNVGPRAGAAMHALIERVRDAENEAETQAGIAAIHKAEADKFRTLWDRHGKNDLIAERDAARGKLDKVRQWTTDPATTHHTLQTEGYWKAQRDLSAILDDEG